MAQKLILCEGAIGEDLLATGPLAAAIADGFEVTSVSGYSARDNRHIVAVLLSEPATNNSENDTEPQEGGGSDPQEGGEGGEGGEGTGTQEGGEGGEGGEGTGTQEGGEGGEGGDS